MPKNKRSFNLPKKFAWPPSHFEKVSAFVFTFSRVELIGGAVGSSIVDDLL